MGFVPDLFQAAGESVGTGFITTFWPNSHLMIDWHQDVGPDPFANDAWKYQGSWVTRKQPITRQGGCGRLFNKLPFGRNSHRKHLEVGSYLPTGYSVTETNWRHQPQKGPFAQISEDGYTIAWFGIFSQMPLKAQRVFCPDSKWFQPRMPRPETLGQLELLLESVASQLPRRLAPIPVARLNLAERQIVWERCWIELPVPVRVVVPKVPGQEPFGEWLTNYFSSQYQKRTLAHQSWTTHRIAGRMTGLVQGLKSHHSAKFDCAVELYRQFAHRTDPQHFPGFLPLRDSGVNLLVEHLPSSPPERSWWQRMHGHFWQAIPNLNLKLAQAQGEKLAGRPARGGLRRDQEYVCYLTAIPNKWLVLQELIEKAPANY